MQANDTHCFHCGRGAACCDSKEAHIAYAEGGYACEQCLSRFHNMSARAICDAAAVKECRLTDAFGLCSQSAAVAGTQGLCPRTKPV